MYGEDKLTDMDYLPLSSSQMNIWNLEMAHPGLPMNNICTALKIEGNLNLEYLQNCIELVFRAFPSLRTRITLRDGKPCQYISEEIPSRTVCFDFSGTDEQGIEIWFQSVAREHFTLMGTSLCQMTVFKISENNGGILTRVHHIIADAWSHALVTNHIIHNYFQLLLGQEPDCMVTPSYKEHILNEQKYLKSKAFEKDKSFWGEALKNISPGLAKEYQCAVLSPVGLRKSYRLSNRLNRLIGGFCEKAKVSPFAVFYMGLAIYLRRVRGQERFCIGVPTINRLNFKEKQTGGMFVNTLPFVNELDISMTWNRFNVKLQEDWFSLLYHQRIPFEMIKKLAGSEGRKSSEPLFDIVLSYQNGKMDHLRGARVSLEGRWMYSGYQSEALCIHLSSRDKENQFVVDYDYLTQIFSEQEITRLHDSLSRILKEALQNPDLSISGLPILDEETEEQVVYDFNQTDVWYDKESNLASKLEESIELHPNRAAVIFQGNRTSYRQLSDKGEWAAQKIIEKLSGRRGTIAIHIERGMEIFVALAGIIFSGNSWLFIDKELPKQRKIEMLQDSQAVLCIVDKPEDILEQTETTYHIPFITLSGPIENQGKFDYPAVSSDELAYLVYTSGSTGTPKAVEVEQHSVLNLADAMSPLYPKGAVLSICNVGFDAFLLESVSALLNARTVVLASREEMNNPQRIAQLIQNYDVGFMALTPSRLSAYMKNREFRKSLPHLETIICGGENLPPELYKRLSNYTSGTLYNQYGPSEATVAVSHAAVSGKEPINIGYPLQNCRIYILDEFMNPLPPGSVGEIYLGGECLARGYHNRKELTHERFLEDPFIEGGRIYRTGDFGKWSADGKVFYLGRRDNQVKLLGHRIELSEIEAVLMRHPKTEAVAVTVWEEKLVAYFVGDESLTEEELLAYAANYLPRYLLPVLAIKEEYLPLTENGKIDFALLEKPCFPEEKEEPVDDVEERLLDIWKRVLGYQELGVNSDYFLSGGDSLNAVLMLLEVEKEFSRTVSVSELYGFATVRRLGNLIRGKAVQIDAYDKKMKKADEQEWYPLTPAQEGFFVMHQLDETKIGYNMPMALQLGEWLDFPKLEDAFQKMVDSDPVLRTVFLIEDGQAVARVKPQLKFEMEWLEAASVEDAMSGFVRPFDLEKGPLIRAAMLKLPENEPYLLLDMHHIISDGLSSQILLSRLNLYYIGEKAPMPELTFIDYAWWIKENQNPKKKMCRDFWKEQTSHGLPEKTLPLDRPRPAVFDGKGARYQFELPEYLNQGIQKICNEYHVTVFMLLLSVYGLLLGRYSGADEVVVGTPFSGRRRQNLEEMTGVFVNSLPVFIQVDSELKFKEYLEKIRKTVTGMLDHQEISLEELVKMCGIERTREKNPLFSVLFTMTPLSNEEFSIGNAALTYIPYETHSVKMDLNLEVVYMQGRYQFQFEYAESLFDEVTIAFYSRCFLCGMAAVLENPGGKLEEITLLEPADKIRLLEQPKRIRTPYDATTVDQAMDYIAISDPDRAAVFWGDKETYTYGELKKITDMLASALQNAGIGIGSKVAFLTRRTGMIPVFMFGILKAGAAYVPIDPDFPTERILYMLGQAGVQLVVYESQELFVDGSSCEVLIWNENISHNTAEPLEIMPDHGPDDAANVIFTSGTTGKPKGVVMLHKSLSNLSAHLEPLLGDLDEKILCASNCVFDVFTTETILALGKGYPISIADEEEMLLPWKMAERITKDKATILQLTPSRIQMCLGDEDFRKALQGIRRIILLGEPWGLELKERLRELTEARIFNIYGPTETSVHNCQGDITEEHCIHIGKPIGNCRYYLLDEQGKQVPPTAIGEIYIAGECLSSGYINQKGLTDEVFVPDCFCKGGRMYKTGDMGRLRADGNWQCLGRMDTQVKLNGHRIEPMEIAEVMLQSGLVKEAVVVPVLKNGIPSFLRGVVVEAGAYQEDALREYLRRILPDYMQPSEICTVKVLPRTASGKTDLKMLALPHFEVAEQVEELESMQQELPQVRTESGIMALWREVLGKEPDREISFFEQGGTSLMAILILNRYHQEHYDFSINDFYHHPILKEQETILGITAGSPSASQVEGQEKEAVLNIPRKLAVQEEKGCIPGAIFLTGATGYMGSHILKKLLDYGNDKIYCLIRGQAERLETVMDEYFGYGVYEKYQKRIQVIKGELTTKRFGVSQDIYTEMVQKVTRVYHCAADVRHYAAEEELLHTNVEGTVQVIEFVRESGASLMHMSTISVAGNVLQEPSGVPAIFTEEDLDIGQNWQDNPYVKSKILAEKLIDDAVKEGLCANIFRIGRLAANSYNGRFQRNPESNAYYRLMKGILELGMLPEVWRNQKLELTPVNQAAEAVIRLSGSTGGAYHIFSPYEVKIGALAEACMPIKWVELSVFDSALKEKSMQSKSPYIQALAQVWFDAEPIGNIKVHQDKTLDKLAALDFWWGQPDIEKQKLCFWEKGSEEKR